MNSSNRKVCSDLDVTDLSDQNVLTLRVMPMPADANVYGDVFGCWIMSQGDIAGAAMAGRRADGRIATVAVNSFVFRQHVFVGDLLTFYAKLIKVGKTSIMVKVEMYAGRNKLRAEVIRVTEAILTYVATGPDRMSRLIPFLNSLGKG